MNPGSNGKLTTFGLQSIGLIAIALCLVIAFYFPINIFVVIPAIIALAGLLLAKPRIWLCLLPILWVSVDLAPWTGGFLINEVDIILLLFIGVLYFRYASSLSLILITKSLLPLSVLLLVMSNVDWVGLLTNIQSNQTLNNPYYSEVYSFKVAKGIIYGFLLSVIFAQQFIEERAKTLEQLFNGSVLASIILFFIVLWERGTISAIIEFKSIWAIANSLLDFTSSYRVTALFSDMHTGGEAYDGIVLLLLPLNLSALLWYSAKERKFLSLVALFCIGYCVLVGYTRTTYLAALIEVVVILVLFRKRVSNSDKLNKGDIAILLLMVASCVLAFKFGGYMSLLASVIMIVSTFVISVAYHRNFASLAAVNISFIVLYVFSTIIAWNYASESRWIEQSLIGNIVLAFILGSIGMLAFYYFVIRNFSRISSNAFSVLSVVVLSFIFSVVFGSYQFSERMKTIDGDIQMRLNHWSDVIDSSRNDIRSILFGNGLGTFPLNYAISSPENVKDIGSFTVSDSGLTLGKGDDLTFGQRLNIEPMTEYNVTIEIGNAEQVSLSVGFCERNLIYASNFTANCSSTYLKSKKGEFTLKANIESADLGGKAFFWPTTLVLRNRYSVSPVSIKAILVTKADSNENLLKNSRFAQGMDYWFFYNDFSHLPWHIKNTYLSVYYQLGVIGGLLLIWLLFSLIKNKCIAEETKVLQVAVTGAILGFGGFAFFGDPFDSAKVNTIFFILIIGLYQLQLKAKLLENKGSSNAL